jgi:hypothetical protein
MSNARLTAYIMFGIGGLLLVGGLAWGNSVRRFVAKAQKATGVVARLVGHGQGAEATFRPAVRFEAADGTPVEFVSSIGTTEGSAPAVGTSVEVLYLPENPEDAKINRFMSMWMAPMILILVGGFLVAIGVGLWFLGGVAPKAIQSIVGPS